MAEKVVHALGGHRVETKAPLERGSRLRLDERQRIDRLARRRGQEPPDGEAAGTAGARHVRIGRASKPAARRQQRHGFEKVRLARAVVAVEHDEARTDLESEFGIVAEVGEAQPRDRRRALIGGRGRHGKRAQTRIGIST